VPVTKLTSDESGIRAARETYVIKALTSCWVFTRRIHAELPIQSEGIVKPRGAVLMVSISACCRSHFDTVHNDILQMPRGQLSPDD
jgi:hypothetical protein